MTLEKSIVAAQFLHELNKDYKNQLYYHQFKCLKTRFKTSERWWNSLNWSNQIEVGSVALHFYKMSARYPWKCGIIHGEGCKYNELTKSQKKIVDFCYSIRKNKYSMFHLPGLIGLK